MLTDHIASGPPNAVQRINQQAIANLRSKKAPQTDFDLFLIVIHLVLKLSTKSSGSAKKLVELTKKLSNGKRFLRCHLELMYQYLKVKCGALAIKGQTEKALLKV